MASRIIHYVVCLARSRFSWTIDMLRDSDLHAQSLLQRTDEGRAEKSLHTLRKLYSVIQPSLRFPTEPSQKFLGKQDPLDSDSLVHSYCSPDLLGYHVNPGRSRVPS